MALDCLGSNRGHALGKLGFGPFRAAVNRVILASEALDCLRSYLANMVSD